MMTNNVFQILSQMLPNVPNLQNVNSPDELAQMLLNSGKVNQSQVNQAKQMWQRLDIQRMINQRFKL